MKVNRNILLALAAVILFAAGCGQSPKEEQSPADEQTQTDGQAEAPKPPQAVVETVQTENFTMQYCKFGQGDKVLVILPGISVQSVMGSADAIAEAYQIFAEDYTVYLFDRRDEVPAGYSVFDLAEDTAVAIRALGLEHINLFGASYGGMGSMALTLRHPDLVDRLVLASTSADLTDEEYKAIENWIRLAKGGDAAALYLAFGEAVYPKDMFEQSRDAFLEAAQPVTEEELQKFITLAEGMKGFSVREELAGINCPVLAIGDRQDHVLGAEGIETIGRLMDGKIGFEIYMYDGYGHAVYDMAPDFKERMLDFLQEE